MRMSTAHSDISLRLHIKCSSAESDAIMELDENMVNIIIVTSAARKMWRLLRTDQNCITLDLAQSLNMSFK